MLNNIEAERVGNRLSKEELAKKLGVSMRTYCNWIKEDTDILGVALIRLGRMFGTDVDYLMQGCTGIEEKEVV
ncbi:helix-turn-helix transcriptional regulator [Lachnospiraceae bacterium 62-26]|mgnify:CR=1 FL=1